MDAGYRTMKDTPEADPNLPLVWRCRISKTATSSPHRSQLLPVAGRAQRFLFYAGHGHKYQYHQSHRYVLLQQRKDYSTSHQDDSDDFRTVNYAFQTGMGWEYAFSERFMMVLTPTFKFWMRGVLKENDLNRNLYSIGLNARLMFQSSYRE